LSATGDAEFSGPVPPIPSIAADRWIANGAVRTGPGN